MGHDGWIGTRTSSQNALCIIFSTCFCNSAVGSLSSDCVPVRGRESIDRIDLPGGTTWSGSLASRCRKYAWFRSLTSSGGRFRGDSSTAGVGTGMVDAVGESDDVVRTRSRSRPDRRNGSTTTATRIHQNVVFWLVLRHLQLEHLDLSK